MKPRKPYRPRLVRIPVTGLRDQIALHMHAALVCLEANPGQDAFDGLGAIFNVIGLTIEHDSRLSHEARLIAGGAAAMNQIEAKVCQHKLVPQNHEIAPIRIAVNAIDRILPWLDVSRMHLAQMQLRMLQRPTTDVLSTHSTRSV
ncbi:hypothetical protein [Paralcaligenes ginsengisoli]